MAAPIDHCSAPSLPVTDGLTHICSLPVLENFCLDPYETEPTEPSDNTRQWAETYNRSDSRWPGLTYIRCSQVEPRGVRLLSSTGEGGGGGPMTTRLASSYPALDFLLLTNEATVK